MAQAVTVSDRRTGFTIRSRRHHRDRTHRATILGYQPAFKTSTASNPLLHACAERPFRLIAAYNLSRFGILNNNLHLTKQFTFRLA
jgi:hypothetical protein